MKNFILNHLPEIVQLTGLSVMVAFALFELKGIHKLEVIPITYKKRLKAFLLGCAFVFILIVLKMII